MAEALPNFFIVGAAKAGTTSLFNYLGEHPQVFVSRVKEPHFFSYGLGDVVLSRNPEVFRVRDWDSYRGLFAAARGKRAVGEGSSSYLRDPGAAPRIRQHVPEARIVILLRDPIERAYSQYQMYRLLGLEQSDDPAHALSSDPIYLEWSRYRPQLQRYVEQFPREQIQIHLYDDLCADAAAVARRTFRFLGVDDAFEPRTDQRYKVGGEVRRPRLLAYLNSSARPVGSSLGRFMPAKSRRWLYWKLRDATVRPSPYPRSLRAPLLPRVRDDILAVQELTGRDLSAWLEA